jgi:predicted dehydrogenase
MNTVKSSKYLNIWALKIPKQEKRRNKMKKFGLAIIGCGRIADLHLQGIQRILDVVDLVATVDIVKERADKYKEKYNARKVYYSVADALRDDEIEGVVLCLAHYLHYPVTIQCLQAKKHVLTEKVMSTNYENALDMVKEAEKNDVTLMVGQSRRYYKAVQESVKAVYDGKLGKVFNIITSWQIGTFEPKTPWWKEKAKTGGLLIMLNGSHSLDWVEWIKKYELPETVYCRLNHLNHAWEGEDEVSIMLGYADNSTAVVNLSFNVKCGYFEQRRLVEGTEGYLLLENETTLTVNGQKVHDEKPDSPSSHAWQIKEFISAIREKREPLSSGRLVAQVNAILDTALLSAKRNQVVQLKELYPDIKAPKI